MEKKPNRVTAYMVIVAVIFTMLISRLLYLQIIKGDYYRSVAENMGGKEINELAPRGELLDRNGLKLATNRQSFNITYANINPKQKNEEINSVLIKVIKIIIKNGDADKINTQNLPIKIEGNNFSFQFNTTSEKLKTTLENNFKKKYKIDENYDAKNTFLALAENFGLAEKDGNGNIVLKSDINMEEMQKLISLRLTIKEVGYSQYKTVYIAKNVSKKTAFSIQSQNEELPSIICKVDPMRYYPNNEVGSAFLGYLGKIDESESELYKSLGYDLSRELIGKLGLEKTLENNKDLNIALRGEPGVRYVQVDKYGRIIKEIASLDPIPGDTVKTTIDLKLQKVAEQALQDTMRKISTGEIKTDEPYPNANRGAAVVVDVNTGEILALASTTLKSSAEDPSYDPNLFVETGSIKDPAIVKKLFGDPNDKDIYDLKPKPMFNYATMGSGPPGSTFKPLTALSALEENVINSSTIINCKGKYDQYRACWIWNERHSSHGPVDVSRALQVSCNYFFFEIASRLGYERFSNWAWKFGLSSNPQTGEAPYTGIEIDEKPGDVSNPFKYKIKYINSTMNEIIKTLSETKYGSISITKGTQEYKIIEQMLLNGEFDEKQLQKLQIDSNTTQGKRAADYIKRKINSFESQANSRGELLNAAIGQGSTLLTPLQMVSYISTLANGGTRYKLHLIKQVLNSDGSVKMDIQPEVISKIDINPQNLAIIKSGMAKVTEEGGTAASAFQNYSLPTAGKTGSASVSEGQRNHGRAAYGWYVGFAPVDNPKIAVAVVIYDAGHGGYVAGIARSIYDAYFGLNENSAPKQNK